MTDEDKAKLRELWDYMEQSHELARVDSANADRYLNQFAEKFEALFTKELND